MSQEKTEEIKLPDQVSHSELYEIVKKTISSLKELTNKVVDVETQLKDLKESGIISSKFSQDEAIEISKEFGEIARTLSTVLVDLASKNIIASIKMSAVDGDLEIQLYKYGENNESNSN